MKTISKAVDNLIDEIWVEPEADYWIVEVVRSSKEERIRDSGNILSNGQKSGKPFTKEKAKESAVRIAEEVARLGGKVNLRIKLKDGTIEEERTYPKSADPKTSKG